MGGRTGEEGVIMTDDRYGFAFDELYRPLLALLGIRPETAHVTVTDTGLRARFGPWEVVTPLTNLAGVETSGPYSALKAIGVRMSLDLGLTFGSSTAKGLCLRFHEPVHGGEPVGLLRHPALTVTVADPAGLAERLQPHVRPRAESPGDTRERSHGGSRDGPHG
jgi:hypothetical protein